MSSFHSLIAQAFAVMRALAVVLAFWLVSPAQAAEFTAVVVQRDGHPVVVIGITGDITENDGERFRQKSVDALTGGNPIMGVLLNSDGGVIVEALNIAERVQGLNLSSAVVGNDRCASACFIIRACTQRRYADVTAKIGIHSTRTPEGNEDIGALALDTIVARQAKKCGVPDHLITKMITTSQMTYIG